MIYRIYIFENILKLQNLKICLVETANFRDYWLELTMNNEYDRILNPEPLCHIL